MNDWAFRCARKRIHLHVFNVGLIAPPEKRWAAVVRNRGAIMDSYSKASWREAMDVGLAMLRKYDAAAA